MTDSLPATTPKQARPDARQRRGAPSGPAVRLLPLLAALLLASPPESAAAEDSFPIMGQTLSGSHWRAAPDPDGKLLATLPPGRAVPIVSRTDKTHDGFNWFEVVIGHQVGYQWGGALCSNDRQIAGIAEQCDPANLKQVGAGPNGLFWVSGLYMMGRGDITGTDQNLDLCPEGNPQVLLWDLHIDDDNHVVSFPYYTCDIDSHEPLGTGLRITGQCRISDWASQGGVAHSLTEAERTLDILVFYADNLNTLHVVDQTGPDSGHITTYAACNRYDGNPYP